MTVRTRRRLVADALRRSAVRLISGPELDARIRSVASTSRMADHVIFGDAGRVDIGEQVTLNDALLNVSSGTITIESTAFFGHGVSLLTGTHDIDQLGQGRQTAIPPAGRDIVVERGAWIASGAIVVGPCRIGAHAVVAAGSVVTRDVLPGTVVAGIPARPTGRVVDAAGR